MAAVWGIVSLSDKTVDKSCFGKMKTHFEKKCQIDKYGSYVSENICMGCGIQYITEHAVYDNMPIEDEKNRLIFTADCILDNREEVISFLNNSGVSKREMTFLGDGELIYLAYCILGRKCVDILRGLYSFAVWNEKIRSLTLFSDYIAGRCLYYARIGDMVIFSTLMEAIRAVLADMSADAGYNTDYYKDFLMADKSLTMIVPGETPYEGIEQIKPAVIVEFTEKGISEERYWDISKSKWNGVRLSVKEWGECFKEVYKACVNDAIRTGRQVGIAMSGGLDSTSVGALAADMLERRGKKLYSYTFVPELPPEKHISGRFIYDESVIVSNLAKKYPNMETKFMNNSGNNLFCNRDKCIELLEMPYKSVNYPDYLLLFEEGRKNDCAVYLTGAFGNTTVSYGCINHILYNCYHQKKQKKLLACLEMYADRNKLNAVEILPHIMGDFADFDKNKKAIWDNYIPDNPFLMSSILTDYPFKERFEADPRWTLMRCHIGQEYYSDFLSATTLMMQLGAVETKLGLHAGVLMRDPTRDMRMIEFCAALPYDLFAYEGCQRWLICGNLREELTEEIILNSGKRGLLNGDYIQRVVRDWNRIKPRLLKISGNNILRSWINKSAVEEYINCFDTLPADDRKLLDYLLAFDGVASFCK